MSIHFTTWIAGNINAQRFVAEGSGRSDGNGGSRAKLVFDDVIPNFTPMLCASWKCSNHKAIALAEGMDTNPLGAFLDAGGTILDRTRVSYPNDWGTIFMTNQLHREGPDRQFSNQTRVGWYTGPSDIVSQNPYTEIITMLSPTTAVGYTKRSVNRSSGEAVEIEYFSDIVFSGPANIEGQLRFEFEGEATYSIADRTFELVAQSRIAAHAG